MKKVLIGCGVAVLIALLALGYLAYSVGPSAMKMYREWTAAIEELNALDEQYPFDPRAQTALDPARFGEMLAARVALAEYFASFTDQLEAMQKAEEEDRGPGWIGSIQQVFDQLAPMLTEVAKRLKEARMSPQEFAFHTRVLWAVLARVDENLAGPELEELRGRYTAFHERYETMRRDQPRLLPLKDLLAGLPPAVLKSAEELMAQDLPRVTRALAVTDVDHLYLQPLERIEDVEPPLPAVQPDALPPGLPVPR
ncbi:MAG TPA: hypothetical protein VFD43_05230 [Planctomycetota bacterium]|nr:hypothetical protein [Planctomycetota bacterium]